MSSDELTFDEVAERSGTTPARIRELVDVGILEPSGTGSLRRTDVMRTRVVAELEAIGIERTALRSGHLSLGYLESAGRRHPRSERTFERAAEDLGVPFAMLERIYVAFGLASPAADERIREEDLRVIQAMPVLIRADVEEGDLLRVARVWGDGARRVAEYLTHYFHTVVEEPFRRRGLGDNQAFEAAIREVGLRIGQSGRRCCRGSSVANPRRSSPSISSTTPRPRSRRRASTSGARRIREPPPSPTSPATRVSRRRRGMRSRPACR